MELPGHLLRLWERAGAAALPLSDLERALPEAPGLRALACAQAAVAVQGLLVRGDRLLARGLAAGWDTQRWEQEAPAR